MSSGLVCPKAPLHAGINSQTFVAPRRTSFDLWMSKLSQVPFSHAYFDFIVKLDVEPTFIMSSESKLSFSFSSKPAPTNMELLLAQAKARKPTSKPAAALFSEEDDDGTGPPPPSLAGSSSGKQLPGPPKPALGRAAQRQQQEALRLDASVFDYDGVYDTLKAAERKREEAKKAESEDRKPKYIENFLASAQTRRLDRLRAEEKMLQLEREKEGDEFEDKEKFVTEAYKKQMIEVRKAEEEEKAREGTSMLAISMPGYMADCGIEAQRKLRKGPGLTAFYKQMLDSSSADHDAVLATASGSGPSLAIKPPKRDEYEPEAEYDPLLAREAASNPNFAAGSTSINEDSGKEVEINDEGEVVDKRSLLKAGLNIMKRPKPSLPNSLLSGQRSTEMLDGPHKSRAVGTAASYQERMERENRRLAEQVKEEAERKRLLHEERMRAEEEAARKRREGDDGEAERKRKEARERFLARKRAREDGGAGEATDAKKPKE